MRKIWNIEDLMDLENWNLKWRISIRIPKSPPTNLGLSFEVVNCLVVFPAHFNPYISLLIIRQISLQFMCTPALTGELHWAAINQSPNECFSIVFISLKKRGLFSILVDKYSPKWRWLAVDIYQAAKRRGKYPTLVTDTEVNSCFSIIILKQWDNIHHKKLIWIISSLVTDANRDAIFSRVARR